MYYRISRIFSLLCIGFLTLEAQDFMPAHELYKQAEQFKDQDNWDQAIAYYQQSFEAYRQLGDWDSAVLSLLGIPLVEYYRDDYDKMIVELKNIEEEYINKASQGSEAYSTLYNYFGVVGAVTEDLEMGLEYASKEMELARNQQDTSSLETAYNNIAYFFEQKGDYQRSLAYYNYALQLQQSYSKARRSDLIRIYENIGVSYYRLKDFDKALQNLRKVQALIESDVKELNPKRDIEFSQALSLPLIELGNFEEAQSLLIKALNYYKREAIDHKLEITFHNLSYCYRENGEFELAEDYMNRALKLYEKKYGSFHSLVGKAWKNLGRIASLQGDHHLAAKHYQQALSSLVDPGLSDDIYANPELKHLVVPMDIFGSLRGKAHSLYQISQYKSNYERPIIELQASLETYQLASDLIDTMRNSYQEGSRIFWVKEVKPMFEEAIEVAIILYRLTSDENFLNKAFIFSEKSKSTLLAEAINESAAKQMAGIPKELLQTERDLKIDITYYRKEIFKEEMRQENSNSARISRMKAIILEKQTAYEELLSLYESNYPSYYEQKYRQNLLDISSLQERLEPEQLIVEYFWGDNQGFAFHINKKEASVFGFEINNDFEEKIKVFISTIRDRDRVNENARDIQFFQEFAGRAYELFQILLQDGLQDKEVSDLLIIPDGLLGYLPFEILLKDKVDQSLEVDYAGAPYLLREFPVSYDYLASLHFSESLDNSPQKQFLGFAPAYQTDQLAMRRDLSTACSIDPASLSLASLRKNREEVQAAAEVMGGQHYLDKEATENHFHEDASGYRILHLAMHGILNDCNPLYSGLVFGRSQELSGQGAAEHVDGFLHAYEIYNLRLNAELVVLSACNTGLGEIAKGEGIMSLARAFKYAGCPNIVMSLWQADDQSTAQIMKSFYIHLHEGMDKGEALQKAKLDYIGKARFVHPFFWGAFNFVGKNELLERTGTWNWFHYLGLAVLILAILFGLFHRLKKR